MKPILSSSCWLVAALCLLGTTAVQGEETPKPPAPAAAPAPAGADSVWEQLDSQSPRLAVPPAWRQKKPGNEEVEAWKAKEGDRLIKLANQARAFATEYPADARVAEARRKEDAALSSALRVGAPEAPAKLQELDALRLAQPGMDAAERMKIRMRQIQMAALKASDNSREAAVTVYLEGARTLAKEFPDRKEPYAMMLEVASNLDPEQGKGVLNEVISGAAPDDVKEEAKGALAKLDAVGKPVELKFTALDGREIDLSKMKGQVVLIDFWATWCGPCVQGMPEVQAAYQKLHERNFEIVGIDLDEEKSALEDFLKAKGIPWPQYFDGKGWRNAIAQKYGINSIPTMWLVDRKGILRDMNGREDLVAKVEKLLAEKD